ncbi:hypothetical protein HQ520_00225 [bacterium]|nr:hypothetical protein [bacterium]
MTRSRKILIVAAAFVGVVLAALVVLPFLFKDRIAARAHAEVERAVDAQVAWGDVGLTFFRNFPNLTLRLDDLSVVGNDPFAGDTLLLMGGFRLVLDAKSLIGAFRGTDPILVRSIQLDEPAVHLRVLEDGAANWDIFRQGASASETAEPSSRSLSVELRSLGINDGRMLLENAQTGLYASLTGVQHTLKGDFSKDRFAAETLTHSDATTVRFAGLPYLEGVALDFQAELDADMVGKRVTFVENELRLNELLVTFAGSVAGLGDNLALDLTFAAPSSDFAQILSLMPAVYAHDFEALETAGTFSLQGLVQGDWGDQAFPSFTLNADVADGMFRYPDLPLPAREISFHLALDNPGGDVDSTVVRLERFHVRIGDEPIDAALTLRTPVSDPDVDLSVRGVIDLADVARTVKLDGVDELTGTVRADAAVRARLSDIDGARWERVAASGNVAARDVTLKAGAIPQPVAVQEASLALSPQRVEVRSLQMQLGSSDVQATGSLDNVLAWVLRGEDLRGKATFVSRFVNLDEWRSDDALKTIPVPAGLDLALEGTVAQLTFGALQMTDARGGLHVKDQRVTLDDFTMKTLGGRIGVNGFYETTDPAQATFSVGLALDSLDIPLASAALHTVRMLAPVASFARGAFSAKLDLTGALGSDMMPLFDVLSGSGSLATTKLSLEGFPALERLAEALSLPQLAKPVFNAVRSSMEIRDGRLFVRPFQVKMGESGLAVAGSNGVDQSLDYQLTLTLPRALLGSGADQAVRSLIAKAGQAGVNLEAADSIAVAVGLTGTVTKPSLQTNFSGIASSAVDQARQLVGQAVGERVAAVEERADSAAQEALARARARADSIIQEAETRAEVVRAEARKLAADLRAEGNRRADQVLAEATNPVARVAAKAVADRIRKEADDKANALVNEADQRAESLLAEARRRADAILEGG